MEKILLALNAKSYNNTNPVTNTVLEFAAYIAKLNRSRLTGIFLDTEQEPVTKPAFAEQQATWGSPGATTKTSIKAVMEQFEEACTTMGARCEVLYAPGSPTAELLKETRFADLLILDAELSFKNKPEAVPTGFVREVLTKSECPVLIAPYSFDGIDEIVFAYDGSASAMFAVKQFTYLFPMYSDKKITILQVNEQKDMPVIEKQKIGNLLQLHYASIRYERLQGTADCQLFTYLVDKKNSLLVMGAFGRGLVSDFFRQSTANILVKALNAPLFIAHH